MLKRGDFGGRGSAAGRERVTRGRAVRLCRIAGRRRRDERGHQSRRVRLGCEARPPLVALAQRAAPARVPVLPSTGALGPVHERPWPRCGSEAAPEQLSNRSEAVHRCRGCTSACCRGASPLHHGWPRGEEYCEFASECRIRAAGRVRGQSALNVEHFVPTLQGSGGLTALYLSAVNGSALDFAPGPIAESGMSFACCQVACCQA